MKALTVDDQVEVFMQLEELCDGDSDQIVAMYRRHIKQALFTAERRGYDKATVNQGTETVADRKMVVKMERKKIYKELHKIFMAADSFKERSKLLDEYMRNMLTHTRHRSCTA